MSQTRRQQFEAEVLYEGDPGYKALDLIVKALPSHASVNYRPDLVGVEVLITHEQSLLGTWAFISNVDEAHRLTDAVRINRHFTNDQGGQYRFPQFA